jgi:hypothetical protein
VTGSLLVIEDGFEYFELFQRLLRGRTDAPRLVRAGDLEEARIALAREGVASIFLDLVFDRTPPASLAGDPSRGVAHLAENQGFHLLDALADSLAPFPVVIAFDFADDPERLEILRRRVPRLRGIDAGAPLSRALEALLSES